MRVCVSESAEVKNDVVGVLLARGLMVIVCWCEGRRASDEYVAVGLLGLRRGVSVVVVLVLDVDIDVGERGEFCKIAARVKSALMEDLSSSSVVHCGAGDAEGRGGWA